MKGYFPEVQSSSSSYFILLLQAEVLYRMVEEQSSLKGDASEIILDLFCGTGTIGLSMAKK